MIKNNVGLSILLLTFGACAGMNWLSGNTISTTLFNSLLLVLFVATSASKLNLDKRYWPIAPSFALVPLFRYQPDYFYIYMIELAVLIIWIIVKNKYFSALAIGGLLLLGNLCVNKIMYLSPLSIDHEKIVAGRSDMAVAIKKHSEQATYIPYRARMMIFRDLVPFQVMAGNLFSAMSPYKTVRAVLLVNLVIIFWALLKRTSDWIPYLSLLISLVCVGLVYQSDTLTYLFFSRGFAIFLVCIGVTKLKLNPKLYYSLLLISLLLQIK